MSNKRPWTRERREKFMATIAARVATGARVRQGEKHHARPEGNRKPPAACSCITCQFAATVGVSDLSGDWCGECRAHPPAYQLGRTAFPRVHAGDWCGEWKIKIKRRKNASKAGQDE